MPDLPIPCREIQFPDDASYTVQEISGNFACGIWIAREEALRGKFVADLRKHPLEPIRVKWMDFRELTYLPELNFYAAIYSTRYFQMLIGGKDPARVNEWGQLTPRSMGKLGRLYWLGGFLCTGDEESVLILKMNGRGAETVQCFLFSTSSEECQLATDGLGRIFVQRHRQDSRLSCYENNDLTQYQPLRMQGCDEVGNSLPVPNTSRLMMVRELLGEGNNRPSLLDLDMNTGRCKIVPLPGMGENSKIRPFTGDWVLICNSDDGLRTDFAQLWNQQTGELLRIRPGMFGCHRLDMISALPDGRIVLIAQDTKAGSILYELEDFWGGLRSVHKPKKLGKWTSFHTLYPDIPRTLPPKERQLVIQKDRLVVCGRKLTPPFTLEQVTQVLGTARVAVCSGVRRDAATGEEHPRLTLYYVWDELGLQGRIDDTETEIDSFSICLSPHQRNLPAKQLDGNVLIGGEDYIEAKWKPFGFLHTFQIGGFTLFTRLPGPAPTDEAHLAMSEYYASKIELSYTPPKSKARTHKYRLPKAGGPVLKFKNLNFKLAVMNVLMYEKGLLEPKFDIWEFAEEYSRRRIDPEAEGFDSMIPEAASWFRRYPIPACLAAEVTEIHMDGGDEINCQLAHNWDGEDDLFDLNAVDEDELRQFPHLKYASIFTTNERAVVPVFRKCGIEVVSAYGLPFEEMNL